MLQSIENEKVEGRKNDNVYANDFTHTPHPLTLHSQHYSISRDYNCMLNVWNAHSFCENFTKVNIIECNIIMFLLLF